jgi:hypothetical protein
MVAMPLAVCRARIFVLPLVANRGASAGFGMRTANTFLLENATRAMNAPIGMRLVHPRYPPFLRLAVCFLTAVAGGRQAAHV